MHNINKSIFDNCSKQILAKYTAGFKTELESNKVGLFNIYKYVLHFTFKTYKIVEELKCWHKFKMNNY